MPVLEQQRYRDPLEVVISDEQARIRRQKKGQKARPQFEPCDGCMHIVRFDVAGQEERMCSMGKKRLIRCRMFDKGGLA